MCLIKDEKNNHKFILKISSWCKKEKRDETPEKNFHEYNYRNRDHIRKHFNQMKYVYWEKRTIYIGKSFQKLGQEEKVLLEQEVM